jgi:predicted lipoprotein with Yx(FWY)xxD motif
MAKICQVVFNIESAAKRISATNVQKSRSACARSSGLRPRRARFLSGQIGRTNRRRSSQFLWLLDLPRDRLTLETEMTHLKMATLSGLIMLAGLAGCSSNAYQPKSSDQSSDTEYRQNSGSYMANSSIGQVMTTPGGRTVYTFDNDQPRQSNCYDACAQHWPPVTADSYAEEYGRMSLIYRANGQRQWAYDGDPLYTYAEDSMRGDVKGDNVGSVWHVVR